MEVAKVLADLLAACFAKESLFPRNGETNTHNTPTNKHTDSSPRLNTDTVKAHPHLVTVYSTHTHPQRHINTQRVRYTHCE